MDDHALLPPNRSAFEKAASQSAAARLDNVPTQIDRLWNPYTCPSALLPWLGWALSIDIWDAEWTESEKRAAIADAILFQRHKGTPASLRIVLDRFDPLIAIVEWFEDRETMDPHTFRLELPLLADSAFIYDERTVAQILRDIVQVKPVRAHVTAVYRLRSEAHAWIVSAAAVAGMARMDETADAASALDPVWDSYLQTEEGEPLLSPTGDYLEH